MSETSNQDNVEMLPLVLGPENEVNFFGRSKKKPHHKQSRSEVLSIIHPLARHNGEFLDPELQAAYLQIYQTHPSLQSNIPAQLKNAFLVFQQSNFNKITSLSDEEIVGKIFELSQTSMLKIQEARAYVYFFKQILADKRPTSPQLLEELLSSPLPSHLRVVSRDFIRDSVFQVLQPDPERQMALLKMLHDWRYKAQQVTYGQEVSFLLRDLRNNDPDQLEIRFDQAVEIDPFLQCNVRFQTFWEIFASDLSRTEIYEPLPSREESWQRLREAKKVHHMSDVDLFNEVRELAGAPSRMFDINYRQTIWHEVFYRMVGELPRIVSSHEFSDDYTNKPLHPARV